MTSANNPTAHQYSIRLRDPVSFGVSAAIGFTLAAGLALELVIGILPVEACGCGNARM
jgi:hypothetical protein